MASDRAFDDIWKKRIQKARAMSPESRVLEGMRLSDESMEVVRDGIRHQHPEADESEIARLLKERIKLMRHLQG